MMIEYSHWFHFIGSNLGIMCPKIIITNRMQFIIKSLGKIFAASKRDFKIARYSIFFL
jgi:hypothetical protein